MKFWQQFRAKLEARRAWCLYCEKRPGLPEFDGYCSPECVERDAEAQAFSF